MAGLWCQWLYSIDLIPLGGLRHSPKWQGCLLIVFINPSYSLWSTNYKSSGYMEHKTQQLTSINSKPSLYKKSTYIQIQIRIPIQIQVQLMVAAINRPTFIYFPVTVGGVSQCLSIWVTARVHSSVHTSASLSMFSAEGVLPPHMAGLEARVRACLGMSFLNAKIRESCLLFLSPSPHLQHENERKIHTY